jgi:hypothetical protein
MIRVHEARWRGELDVCMANRRGCTDVSGTVRGNDCGGRNRGNDAEH